MPKINYAKLYTLRADGRYQGYYRDEQGKRHSVCDRDPERLYHRLREKTAPKEATLGELIDAWEAEYVETLAYKTRESYVAPIRRIKEALGDFAAKDVTARQLGAFLEKLHAQGFEKRSIRLHLTVLKSAYRWGIINEKTDADPTLYVKIPQGLKSETRKPPEDAALEAIRTSVGVPFCEYALLLYYTGLRRGEALALRQEDIDREHRIIHVRRAVQFEHNHPSIKPTKTEAGTRDVHFPASLLPVLPTHKGYIFSEDGNGERLMTRIEFLYRWEKYCAAIGHRLTSHQLRHFYVSAMDDAGVPVTAAQAQVGHAHASTTMDVYTHVRAQKMQKAYAAIDDYFDGADGKSDGK